MAADLERIYRTPSLGLLAGNMVGPGNVDGSGAAAKFDLPSGISTDNTDNVYVAATGNHAVGKITPVGVV